MHAQNLITRFFGMNGIGPDPFGGPLVVVGEEAEDNPFRFSTKYWDANSSLYYYGYRYYSPTASRFLSRDPAADGPYLSRSLPARSKTEHVASLVRVGSPAYVFAGNGPIDRVDVLGLFAGGGPGGPGHGDFPGSKDYDDCYGFDFNAEDRDWTTSPFWPWGIGHHFRGRDKVERDIDAALPSCDAAQFERLMHQGQDTFSHYDNDWRWYPTFHAGYPLPGHPPRWWPGDNPDDDTDGFLDAVQWTQDWLDQWNVLCCKHKSECKWVSRANGCCKQ